MPKFSVVIPAYNRERELSRAIGSCLAQTYRGFEVIVVDDGSTDDSHAVARSAADPRLKVLRHEANRGGNAARNTGARAASGDWIVFLDSDDELAHGALETIAGIEAAVPADIGGIAFMYRRDDGRLSPLPELREGIVDYPSYIAWLEGRRLWDFLCCTRRCTFEHVRYPEGRWSDRALYQLDFAKRYRTLFREEAVAVVHTGADNRLSCQRRSRELACLTAAALGQELDLLFDRHEDGLRRYAPATFQLFRRLRASYHFLAGDRTAGAKQMIACLRATPFLAEAWALLILGLAGRWSFATMRSRRGPAT